MFNYKERTKSKFALTISIIAILFYAFLFTFVGEAHAGGANSLRNILGGTTKNTVRVEKKALENAPNLTGLETRGYRPAPGEGTIQGQVDAATRAGNPTVQRGGQDLFRLRPSGHGQAGATVTPQNVRNVTPDGRVFTGKGPDSAVTPRDIRELYKGQTEYGTSSIRTRSGRQE